MKTPEDREAAFLSHKGKKETCQKLFSLIPGAPTAYWANEKLVQAFSNKLLSDFSDCRQGLITGDNDRFLRSWFECEFSKIGFSQGQGKWYIHYKGGDFRRWYGNNQLVVNWDNDGIEIKSFRDDNGKLRSRPQNIQYYFHEGFTWSALTAGSFSARYMDEGGIFAAKGAAGYAHKKENLPYLIGYVNSKAFDECMSILRQSLDYNPGVVAQMPLMFDEKKFDTVTTIVNSCIELSRRDWNSFEVSWGFQRNPLVPCSKEKNDWESFQFADPHIDKFGRISWHYDTWMNECEERFNQLKSNEEELNRVFIDIYGLQDELTPEIEERDVTVRKSDLRRDIKLLLSYAIGCMFGRYSLNVDGLAYAGGVWDASKYRSFLPNFYNVIPITDEEYLEDDIVTRLCTWLKVVYGESTLEENLDFIAKALGNKGSSSRDIIRNYFLNDFFKDHSQTYSVTGSGKRPIYWLFDSGKQNGFKALIYLHRYNADTIGNLRIDYLHRMQRIYESEISRMQDMIDHSTNAREVGQATKRKDKLTKQLKECREYDEKLAHLALSRIELDLDDGVKVNYRKIQTANDGKFYEVLADSKNIMAKK